MFGILLKLLDILHIVKRINLFGHIVKSVGKWFGNSNMLEGC